MNAKNDLKEFVGTPYYIAPEIILEQPYGSGCDIWSLGVLTYYIIDGEFPFLGKNRPELFGKITSGKPLAFKSSNWKYVGEHCKDFVMKCLTLD